MCALPISEARNCSECPSHQDVISFIVKADKKLSWLYDEDGHKGDIPELKGLITEYIKDNNTEHDDFNKQFNKMWIYLALATGGGFGGGIGLERLLG